MGPLRRLWCLAIYLTLLICTVTVYGCDIQGVTNNWLDLSVTDTDTGIFFQGSTENIGEIVSATHSGDGLNFGPYFVASHENSQFVLSLNENFALYERYETLQSFSVSVTFSCTNGNAARTIIFIVSVIDTNNNDPIFTPTEEFSYTVTPPLPPGYQITGCDSDINVEDIDLTTQRIDFSVENGDGLFEIVYDPASSTSKNFKGILRTTNFVRSIPEPLVLTISATDVDLTGDPQRTTYTTVRIESDGEFEFPDEPVFSQAFYLAAYSEEHEITVDPISLIQGYAEDVEFNLTGVYSQYFNVVDQNNVITISVSNQLPSEVLLNENQLYLVINAVKELTSGASATIVVQLPEAQTLQFGQQLYEGTIVDNVLSAPVLVLSQGYENGYTVFIAGEHSGNFAFTTESNSITLTMSALDDNVIETNNVITLQVTADSGTSAATAVLTLSIIKNDTITPLFESNIYSGSYDQTSGLALQDIVLSQGYDETVSFYLEGEYESLFTIIENLNVVNLQVGTIPQDVIDAGRDILLTLSASKARTVGANTAISIALPRARELGFEHPSYTGQIQDNILTLDPITLNIGYDENVTFNIVGDYNNYFTATNIGNVVTLALTTVTIPDDVILQNNNIILILEAEGANALKASTSIVLEIVKDDTLTPVFSQNIYEAIYSVTGALEIGTVTLTQGYDETVSFRIDGEHSQYFALTTAGNSITLSLPIVPEEVVFSEKTLIFNVIADKPLTVGASSAIVVSFPQEYTEPAVLSFSRSSYVGTLENEQLSLENLVLESGYAAGTEFTLTGEYEASFTLITENNIATVSLSNPLPIEALQNKLVVLEISAQRVRAVTAVASVILEIISDDEIPPVFAEPYYSGTYTISDGLQFSEAIILAQGYDETVTYDLQEGVSDWFTLQQNGNSINLVLSNAIPEATVYANRQLLFSVIANRSNVVARTAVSIDLPDEPPSLTVRFASSSHVGRIEEAILELGPITLLDDYDGASFNLFGDYSYYFNIIQNGDSLTLELNASNPLPEAASFEPFIVLDIEATRDTATAYTAVVLEIVRETDPVPTPVFGQPYYSGSYSLEQGLLLEETISLIQGYSEDVQFALQGDDAEWFVLTQTGNSVTLTIGEAELPETDRTQLLFSIEATRTGALTGNAAIVINLSDSSTTTISFASNSHVGRIESGILYLEPITVLGDFENATFNVLGSYGTYFNINQNGDTITLELNNQLPDEVLLVQSFVVLDIEATRDTTTAYTAVVLEIVRETDPVPTPVFSQPYYSGSYSLEQGLLLEETISLIQGYSEDVQFALQGDDAEWFVLTQTGNSVTLTIGEAELPETDRTQLLFSIEATRTGALTGNAAIVINLSDSSTTTISFASNSHVGRIESGILYLEPITVLGDFENATFNVLGSYGTYFNINQNGDTITLELNNQLPDEVLLVQSFVVLDIEATRDTATAYSWSVVLEIVRETDPVPTPVFSQPYYSGSYSLEQGLLLEETISLIQGYSGDVQFALQGDDAQWFVLTETGNSVTLTIGEAGLPETERTQLLFSIEATRTGALTGNAAIVINLSDSSTTTIGFTSSSHVGRIESGNLFLDPITVLGDFEAATFNVLGAYGTYFNINQNGDTITLGLDNQLPDEVLLVQSFVVLDIEATRDTATAYTAVVLEIVRETDPVPTPVFSQPFYSGSYSLEQGLLLEETISLIQGYSEDVQIALQGDDAQWFVLTQTGNSVTLTIGEAGLPETDRTQLLFSIEATRTGALTGNAAIVINLSDSSTTTISFASNSHVGRIETGILYLEPITVLGDFENATFNVLGSYGTYFNINQNGDTITLELNNQLPDEVLLVQSFVVLDIEATRDTATAYTAVVLEIVRETDPVPTPVFSQPYYSGSYSLEQGLLLEETISLIQGYSEDVQIALQGDDAQWFVLTQTGNSATLTIGEAGLPETDRTQLLFSIEATRTGALTGNAAIVINLSDSSTTTISFASNSHVGRIETGILYLEPITVLGDFENATFNVLGSYGTYFNINQNGDTITLELNNQLPDEVLLVQSFVVLDIEATRDTATAYTAVVLEIVRETDPVPTPVFSQPYYSGSYSLEQGLLLEETISLIQGYSEDVQIALQGDDAQWFVLTQTGNSATLTIGEAGLPETDRTQLLFSIEATRTGALTGNAAIVINLSDSSTTTISFASNSHVGRIETGILYLEPITVLGDFENATFNVLGSYGTYFNINQNGDTITLELNNQLPDEVLLVQSFVVLDIEATRDTATAYTAVVLEIVRETDPVPTPVFSQPYYSGSYSLEHGLLLEETISLIQGYSEDVQIALQGDDAQWFVLTQTGNSVSLTIGEAGLPETERTQLLFSIEATRTGALTGNAAIVINLSDSSTTTIGFASSSHVGRIEGGLLYLDPIAVLGDFEEATFNVLGAYGTYFNINKNGDTITLELNNQLPDEVLLVQSFVVLDIEATRDTATAYTAVVLEIVRETDPVPTPVFSQPYYSGSYSLEHGLLLEETISLIQGYSEDVQFALQGDDAQWFVLSQAGNSFTVSIGEAGLPETDSVQLLFSIEASRAGALTGSAAIAILSSRESASAVVFDKALFRGLYDGSLQHELITVSGYNGNEVEIFGEYQDLFEAQAASGVVVVQALDSVVFSTDILYVGLELSAGGARTALVIDINHSDLPEPPTVEFESSSYEISTDVTQTGLVGRVQAIASNGEPIVYSLAIDSAHLQERLSISSDGELQLFATADTGIYNFAVIAESTVSQVSATATVRMNVVAIAVCGDDEYVVPPLVVINRNEEENYSGLVVLSQNEFPGCHYEMTNRWPLSQDWLYVDDAGLHTTAIDREDESIAFMALSQVQVELVLVCDSDDATSATRVKRDTRPDWLGPYAYGNNEWVLTETILHNSRRTLVNLIVNDINDNAPVFVDKENEPIAVGYPVADLLQVVTPRALSQLKATDRDIGINADLVYWSSSPQLAVGPTTGTVHVRDNHGDIAEGTVMTVHATDQGGEGLTGDIDIVIRFLNDQHIAVVTIRDAFEEDEDAILGNLTNAIGYEVKSLSSTVISDEYDDIVINTNTRRKRQAEESRGASLKLFVYGLIQRDPVEVSQLTNDINNNVIVSVAVADTVSLQDYLASLEICEVAAGRDIGLLVATIVLSVVLFILIVLIGLWFFLRWRKDRNYEEFSDMNSIASRNDSSDGSVKVEPITRPRLAIEEIKRSERRLREMLDAPDEGVVTQPQVPVETIVEIPTSTAPIVIQSIDKLKAANDDSDDDEFGERKERIRKKSVVTFNENVEKIIHVEDDPDDNDDDIEVYKL